MKRKVCAHISLEWKLSRDVLQGITRYAYNAVNWDLTVLRGKLDAYSELYGQVDGVIAMASGDSQVEKFKRFSPRVLSYSNSRQELAAPRVISDDYAVGVRAAEYYLSLGFTRFAFASYYPEHNYSVKRYEGFRDTLSIAHDEPTNLTVKKGMVARIKNMAMPLAVLAADDVVASELVNKLVAQGISVPEQVAVLGVNNDETFCALARVPLSSVELSSQRVGFQAAKTMDAWLENDEKPKQFNLIEPQGVVERQSTRSYGVSDAVVAQAMQYIRNNFTDSIRVEDISKSCGVGRRTLERRFEDLLERSPHEAVIDMRMDAAKKLLVQTDFSMEEIAGRSGFSNKRQLSSTFRRVLNLTPSDYRRKHQLR